MGLITCILWMVLGVLYIIYKLGEESLGSKAGGIGCVFAAIFGISVFTAIVSFSMDLVVWAALAGIVVGIVYLVIRGIKKANSPLIQKERYEISLIRKDLPMPTNDQMQAFLEEIQSERNPSVRQATYLEILNKSKNGVATKVVDEECFMDMQAAWIYYSKNDSHTTERWLFFRNQDLSTKEYFTPIKE